MKLIILITLLCLLIITVASGEEIRSIILPDIKIELKEGNGLEKVKAHCNLCHSLDYITMQPPFQEEKWTAIVNKMRKVFGAPIPDDDAGIIIRYLSTNYGKP